MAKHVVFRVFAAMQNEDLTEGRGKMVPFRWFSTLEAAVQAVQGKGVMGYGTGQVNQICYWQDMATDTEFEVTNRQVYGYRKRPDGIWDYGYNDLRDLPQNDPEWIEYLRLQQKFGDKRA